MFSIMKRIIAALSGKVEKFKMERKVNRVNRAIESATDNANDAIERIEEEKSNLMKRIANEPEVSGIINHLSELIDQQEEQEAIIARLEKVSAYINEDIETEGE
jgi:uncharacterized membrane-anchored protein YjiN (DUF445 family)